MYFLLHCIQVGPNDVCGCPAKWDPAVKEHPVFCRQSKRSCTKHYCWEKLYHAELDQEKLNQVNKCTQTHSGNIFNAQHLICQWLKLEDLNEQIRMIQWQMSYRGSLLGMMLHSTIVHDKQ